MHTNTRICHFLRAPLLPDQVQDVSSLAPELWKPTAEVAKITHYSILKIQEALGSGALSKEVIAEYGISDIEADNGSVTAVFRDDNGGEGRLTVNPTDIHSIMRLVTGPSLYTFTNIDPEGNWTWAMQIPKSDEVFYDQGIASESAVALATTRGYSALDAANAVILTAQNLGDS